jgi:ABC-type glycerol-3-phosphate transport system substrate-binding protein
VREEREIGMLFSRRDFLSIAAKGMATGGAMALLAACGQAPTAPPNTAPAPTAAPPNTAAATPTAAAAAAAAAKPVAATPTAVPLLAPVPQPPNTTKLLLRVHWEGVRLNDFLKYINDYNSTQGPKDGIYIAVERTDQSMQTYLANYQANSSEDIYHLNDVNIADLASRNFFAPPPKDAVDYINQTYVQSSIQSGTYNNQLLGYPTENQPHLVSLHQPIFKAAGLTVSDAPKTFDDIRRLAKQLTKVDAGKKVQCGWIVHNEVDPSFGPDAERNFITRCLYQFLEGAPLFDTSTTPPKFDITSDAARKYTDLQYNLIQDGSTNADMGDAYPTWQQGRGGMYTEDAWAFIYILRDGGQPGILDQTAAVGLRSSDGSKTGNISRNYHYVVSSKSQHQDLAWQFMKWMNHGPEYRMQDYMTNVYGFIPSVKDYPMPKVFPDQIKQAFVDSLKEPNQTAMPTMKGLGEIQKIFRDADDALFSKQLNADDYTKRIDSEVRTALQKAYS